MPCIQPFRDDLVQPLLYKIASCLFAGGSGVTSFNGLTGAVTFTGADVITLLGFTPISQADGDARYVLKTGDTMSGLLTIDVPTGAALLAGVSDAGTINQPNVLQIFHRSSGVPAVGFGSTLQFLSDTDTLVDRLQAALTTEWTVATDATRTSKLTFTTKNSGLNSSDLILSLGQTQVKVGTGSAPGLTFQGDLDTGMYSPGADSVGFSAGGSSIFTISTTGVNLTTALAYQYNSTNVIRAQTALGNYYFGPSGNLTGTGNNNVAIGNDPLNSVTSGSGNVAIGTSALSSLTTGSSNLSEGLNALFNLLSGDNNIAVGSTGLFNLVSGSQNTSIGFNTGLGITTGSNNTIIGSNVTGLAAALSNNIILADGAGVIRIQVDSSGNTTFAGTIATSAGTAALPSHTFSGDLNTGLYNIGADSVGLSTGGTLRVTTNTTDLLLATGFRLAMASGANTRTGNAVLVAGTVTVANTSVTANTVVLLTRKTAGGTLGTSITYTVIAATSFTITSDSAIDTSTFSYLLIENP